jgi:hypothetical protein
MHGTVGVAPPNLEVRLALVPGSHGGNMDSPEVRPGTTVYLGVNVEGGLFSIGDGHFRQGEGETCGVAVEGAMDTVLIVDLIKDRLTPWPRFEDDTHIMSTGSARPLEDAFRIAHGGHGRVARRGVRDGEARRLPAPHADLREPRGERLRPELHVRREGREAIPARGGYLRSTHAGLSGVAAEYMRGRATGSRQLPGAV